MIGRHAPGDPVAELRAEAGDGTCEWGTVRLSLLTRAADVIDALRERAATLEAACFDLHNGLQRAEEMAEREGESIAALRAIIAGRTTAPTDAEIDAHHAAGGWWKMSTDGGPGDGIAHDPWNAMCWRRSGRVVRWWAHAADRAPCPWPEVSDVG